MKLFALRAYGFDDVYVVRAESLEAAVVLTYRRGAVVDDFADVEELEVEGPATCVYSHIAPVTN